MRGPPHSSGLTRSAEAQQNSGPGKRVHVNCAAKTWNDPKRPTAADSVTFRLTIGSGGVAGQGSLCFSTGDNLCRCHLQCACAVRIRTYYLVLNYCKTAGRLRVLKFGVGRHHSATVTSGKASLPTDTSQLALVVKWYAPKRDGSILHQSTML